MDVDAKRPGEGSKFGKILRAAFMDGPNKKK